MKRYGRRAMILGSAAIVGLTLGPGSVPAWAQSPGTNSTFIDYSPSNYHTGRGVIVEGLGWGSCPYSLSSTESETVRYINASIPVIAEVSPQSACASTSTYDNDFDALEDYVVAHASAAKYQRFWGGIMVDEEDGFGFSVGQIEGMNNSLDATMRTVNGPPWWYTEDFSSTNAWSESTWNSIVGYSNPAPQIASTYMKNLVNHEYENNYVLVTWSSTYPSPFNTRSYDDGSIGGSPYTNYFGFTTVWYWDNEFIRA